MPFSAYVDLGAVFLPRVDVCHDTLK
jgi:hypothetical protein